MVHKCGAGKIFQWLTCQGDIYCDLWSLKWPILKICPNLALISVLFTCWYCDSDKWFLTFIHDWLCEEDTGDDSHYGGDRSAKQDWGWGVAASKSTLIIYIEVNSLSSEFQPGSSSNSWDMGWGTVQTPSGNGSNAFIF